MAITFSLAPNPKWYIADLVGKPLAGGYLATFESLDPTQIKLVFEDPAGQFPWPYVAIPNTNVLGILFDENGSQGPFYFEFDSSTPDDLYFLEVYDSRGVLQWTIDDFAPPTGGGGSIITEAIDLENLVANNVMYRNIGQSSLPTPLFLKLAPGANAGLSQTPANAGPDICYIKNNTNANDQLTFINFTLGTTPFSVSNDVTPEQYLNYTCNNAPVGETFKYVQFPITSGAQNLTNQAVTITIWARVNAGPANTLTLQWLQFYGDGASASSPTISSIQTITLTSGWNKFQINTTVPSALGKNLGECGNSGLFLRVQYPLGVACNIDFTKPSVYLGNVAPRQDYHTYDMIDALINTPRTGDLRQGFNAFAPYGWVAMNDGSIGSASSSATARANIDTFPLYNLLWNSISNTYAPVNGGRGASAILDFEANKALTLTRALGRVFAGTLNTEIQQSFTTNFGISNTNLLVSSSVGFFTGVPVVLIGGGLPTGLQAGVTYYAIQISGTVIQLASSFANALSSTPLTFSANGTGTIQVAPYQLGQTSGEETHLQSISEMPSHNHPGSLLTSNSGTNYTPPRSPFINRNDADSGTSVSNALTIASQGGGQPFNVIQPTTYVNMFIKL